MVTDVGAAPKGSLLLNIGLWLAQAVVAAVFAMSGWMKLTTPIPQLSAMMPWTGELPIWFVRTIGVIDLAGGIGILIPALIRIKPGLTVLAALGCVILQICAILFHVSRGEAMMTPLNFVLLALAAFILWGRRGPAPIRPRA